MPDSSAHTTPLLAQQLLTVLSHWPAVRIGEFASLVRKEQPARWDPDSGLIYPPGVTVDVLPAEAAHMTFSEYLQQYAQVPAPKATLVASKLLQDIQTALVQTGSYVIPGLGTISQTSTGELSFYTNEDAAQQLDDNYFALRKVQGIRAVGTDHRPGPATTQPAMTAPKSRQTKQKESRLLGWKFFLAVMLAGTLSVLVWQYGPWSETNQPHAYPIASEPAPFSGNDPVSASETTEALPNNDIVTSSSTSSPVDSDATDGTAAPEESASGANERVTEPAAIRGEEDVRESLIAENQPATREPTLPADDPVSEMGVFRGQTRGGDDGSTSRVLPPIRNYHLIAGSFNSRDHAQTFSEQLKEEGYDAIILFPEAGSGQPHRVSIFRDADRNRVASYAERLKELGRKSGWIYAERSFPE